MHQLGVALIAAGFNVQQMLASGVIGAGAAVIIAAVAQSIQRSKPPAEGQSTPKKLNPIVAVLLVALGFALVVAGIVWRVASQQPNRQ